jgi:sodium transport system permease protein
MRFGFHAVLTVFRKEVAENLRERRTVMSALFFGPIFGPVFFALMISMSIKRTTDDWDTPLKLPVVGASVAPNLMGFLREQGTQIVPGGQSLEEARAGVREGRFPLVLIIPPDYPQHLRDGDPAAVDLVWDSSDGKVSKQAQRARELLESQARRLATQRLLVRGVDPNVAAPIVVRNVDVATPAGRAVLLLGMMTYFLLFASLMGGMYLAIDATAGERERGSLESLFTLPVDRRALVLGKILATCFFMTVSLACTLVAFAVSFHFLPLESLGMSANLGAPVLFAMWAVVLPFIPLGAGLMLLIGSLTRTYREAQTWIGLVLLIPTLPIVFASINSLRPTHALMLVPSLSQHFLATSLLRGDSLAPLDIAISVGATLLVAAIMIAAAIRSYQREAVLG